MPSPPSQLLRLLYTYYIYYSGSFECLEDDLCDDTFTVTVSELLSNEKLFSPEDGTREGVFKLDDNVKPGSRYALCFDNDDATVQKPIGVGFSVRLANAPRTLPDDEIGPDSQRALQLVNKATAIHQDWQALLDHFDFFRNREAVQTKLSDGTLSRLQRWTWIESLLVASMAAAQVWYWKRFFETRRYL